MKSSCAAWLMAPLCLTTSVLSLSDIWLQLAFFGMGVSIEGPRCVSRQLVFSRSWFGVSSTIRDGMRGPAAESSLRSLARTISALISTGIGSTPLEMSLIKPPYRLGSREYRNLMVLSCSLLNSKLMSTPEVTKAFSVRSKRSLSSITDSFDCDWNSVTAVTSRSLESRTFCTPFPSLSVICVHINRCSVTIGFGTCSF